MAILFWIVAILRFLAVRPFVIDDDEAWWSAASNALHSPWNFYRSAADHKPPGVVWFYWLVNHIIPCSSDPRVIRAVYTLLTLLAAGVLGWIAYKFSRQKGSEEKPAATVGWLAATLFLLITAIPVPKTLAVTADGLIAIFTIFGYALALFFEFPGVSILAGVILGFGLLMKQTAVFFAIPVLFSVTPRKWSWRKEVPLFALGALLVLVPCILGVGISDFFYWTWTYPKQILIAVRGKLFDSNLEMLETLVIYGVATLPLIVLLAKKARASYFGLRDFRVLWLISGIAATLLGKALFLHYLYLFAPPFALLAADAIVSEIEHPTGKRRARQAMGWLGAQYLSGAILLMIPSSGIFWGTDLNYFSELSRVLKRNIHPGERMMVWGGSALPLTYTGALHVTRFVLPRFAVYPYATERNREIFKEELAKDIPELVLDLHERGDNQFNNPIESDPIVSKIVQGYHVYVSESVPWAKFYFRNPPPPGGGLVPVSNGNLGRVEASFPREQRPWMDLVEDIRKQGISRAGTIDWTLRAQAALELLSLQSADANVRLSSQGLLQKLRSGAESSDLHQEIADFLSQRESVDGVAPFPLKSFAWWPSVALVQLQPKAYR